MTKVNTYHWYIWTGPVLKAQIGNLTKVNAKGGIDYVTELVEPIYPGDLVSFDSGMSSKRMTTYGWENVDQYDPPLVRRYADSAFSVHGQYEGHPVTTGKAKYVTGSDEQFKMAVKFQKSRYVLAEAYRQFEEESRLARAQAHAKKEHAGVRMLGGNPKWEWSKT